MRRIQSSITFPVALPLKEQNEKISLSTNKYLVYSVNSMKELINNALKYHSEGKILKAKGYYQYCIDNGCNDARVFSNYATLIKDNKKLAEALINKAIIINPNYSIAYFNLGKIQRELGKLKEAKVSIQKSIEINKDLTESYSLLSNIYKELGNLEQAEINLRKALKLKPNSANFYCNLGTILLKSGDLLGAEESTRKAIELDSNLSQAFSNLGNILRETGNNKEAESCLRKAIKINPNLYVAYSNLSNTLKDIGKLEEAETFLRKAIEINPEFANAYCNLGALLFELNKLQEAEECTRKAIKNDPNQTDAYSNLSFILKESGKIEEGFESLLEAIRIDPSKKNSYSLISLFLRDSDTKKLKAEKIRFILKILIKRNDINHKILFKAFYNVYDAELIKFWNIADSKLINHDSFKVIIRDQLFLDGMKKIIFKDMKLEIILTKARRELAYLISANKKLNSEIQVIFIYYLAEQCFMNEYIYSMNETDSKSIDTIIERCKTGKINDIDIGILACYFPLYKLLETIPSLKSISTSNKNLKEILNLQIKEPMEELFLSKKIKKLGSINDKISKKVKSQYEQNPYPRWKCIDDYKELNYSAIQAINSEIKPNSVRSNFTSNKLKVLIAGCGTGHQLLQAKRYKNSEITAIDLSCSSLSYAQRKLNELEISNVSLIQMDILDVELLDKQFDIIECCGVLHHMEDPVKGLKSLINVLNINGYMRLSLYNKLARQHINEARKYIREKNLDPTEKNIRDFRNEIFLGKIPKLNFFTSIDSDFWTTSHCRDLCFHFQEHQFEIKEINKILKDNRLKFLGFLLENEFKTLYSDFFPKDKEQSKLENWIEFERKYPEAFGSTPPFWVSRIT